MKVIIIENKNKVINSVKKALEKGHAGFRIVTITKKNPEHSLEIVAEHVKSALNTPIANGPTVLKTDTLVLDTKKHEVIRDGTFIRLAPKEYKLLEFLMRHANQVVSRRQLLDYVWNTSFQEKHHELTVHMRYLRRRIDEGFQKLLIHTVHGTGYILQE